MEPAQHDFNLFVRRWQVRLFAAAFVLPPLLFALFVALGRKGDTPAIVCILVGGMLLLTTLLLQLWCFERRGISRKSAQKAPAPPREASASHT